MRARLFFFLLFILAVFTILIFHEVLVLLLGASPINFFLASTLFVGIMVRYTWALALSVIGGVLLDFFSVTPGAMSIPVLFSLIITNTLFIHFFTNRSLWTLLLLGGIGTASAYTFTALFTRSFSFFISTIATQLIVHMGVFAFFFFLLNTFTARLKPYILIRDFRSLAK